MKDARLMGEDVGRHPAGKVEVDVLVARDHGKRLLGPRPAVVAHDDAHVREIGRDFVEELGTASADGAACHARGAGVKKDRETVLHALLVEGIRPFVVVREKVLVGGMELESHDPVFLDAAVQFAQRALAIHVWVDAGITQIETIVLLGILADVLVGQTGSPGRAGVHVDDHCQIDDPILFQLGRGLVYRFGLALYVPGLVVRRLGTLREVIVGLGVREALSFDRLLGEWVRVDVDNTLNLQHAQLLLARYECSRWKPLASGLERMSLPFAGRA